MKNLIKKWWFWLCITMSIILILFVNIVLLSNKMTPEETVSKFMYLIENKEYEKAKKLSNGKLEMLDILSGIKPSNLIFDFSEDKKSATAVVLEDEIETTNINIIMQNTLLGWKIQSYKIITDLIDPQILENRLKSGKTLSDVQLLYWGESEIASKDEIAEYAKDNAMVAMIFAETMKAQKYDKANELYHVTSEKDLTINNLKEYNWHNYKMVQNLEIMKTTTGGFNSITIKLENKNIWVYIAGKKIISIIESTV